MQFVPTIETSGKLAGQFLTDWLSHLPHMIQKLLCLKRLSRCEPQKQGELRVLILSRK